MTIVATTIVHPNPGTAWDDVQKQLKRATQLASKHGAENVTVMVNMIGGQGTNAIGVLMTAQDWAAYGQIQQGFTTDPDFQGLMVDAGQIATWENYVLQTIDI
jgi:tripartite-type tricarboxylate transporter receptor subunit TctC